MCTRRVIPAAVVAAWMLGGCVYQRPFISAPYEPIVVDSPGEVAAGVAVRPFSYIAAEITGKPTEHLVVRGGWSGGLRLDNYHASCLFTARKNNARFFAGPSFNYQHNVKHGSSLGFSSANFSYNCRYYSPGAVLGLGLTGDAEDPGFQTFLKVQYNYAPQYEYYLFRDNGDSGYGYRIIEDEKLSRTIPPFLSFEPTFAFLEPIASFAVLKFQIGLVFLQRSFSNSYSFISDYNMTKTDRVSKHPRAYGLNISMGIVFRGNTRSQPNNEY